VATEDGKKEGGKGFAGLASLVSDVDTILPPAVEKKTVQTSPAPSTAARSATQTAQPEPQPKQPPVQTSSQPASEPSSDNRQAFFWYAIGAIVFLVIIISNTSKQPSYQAPAYSPPSQANSTTTPSRSAPSIQPSRSSRPTEDRPPAGQNHVLSTSQIRYCLAENIRIDGARSVVDNYNDSHVDRFNAMIDDYNSRCGEYRYRRGALESARRDIEPYRSELQAEGQNRLARGAPVQSSSTPAPSRRTPDATVLVIQRKLNELGYDVGTPDGLMGRKTRSAIIEFQQNRGLPATGKADQTLLRQLESARIGGQSTNKTVIQDAPARSATTVTIPFSVAISTSVQSLSHRKIQGYQDVTGIARKDSGTSAINVRL
jgi:peptidoglycan hydrolase-like protein with peptidoglycan-binding domain